MSFQLDDDDDDTLLGDHFFPHPLLGSARASTRHQTQELCGTLNATRWGGTLTLSSTTTDPAVTNGTSPSTRRTRASPQPPRSPSERPFSHQHQFQPIETLVPFQAHGGARMDQQRFTSSRNPATDLPYVELQGTIPIEQFLSTLHIFHIRDPGRGSGKQGIHKASLALEKLLDVKKSVVKIKNDDELCCARAIVAMKAYCDLGSRHTHYRSLRQARPVQGKEAQTLHRHVGVPEGPCISGPVTSLPSSLVSNSRSLLPSLIPMSVESHWYLTWSQGFDIRPK